MRSRVALNEAYHQQAVRSADYLAENERAEFINECLERRAFEQACLVSHASRVSPVHRYATICVAIGLVSLLVGGIIYAQTDRLSQVQQGVTAHQSFQQQQAESESRDRNERYIVTLQNHLRDNPNNGDLWYELGQAYALNNEFEQALTCYGYADKLLGGRAAVWGAMATADYYLHHQNLTSQAKMWIEQALAKDPSESASLLLLASDSFLRNEDQQALAYWRKVLDSDNEMINRRAVIQSMEMARQRLNSRSQE